MEIFSLGCITSSTHKRFQSFDLNVWDKISYSFDPTGEWFLYLQIYVLSAQFGKSWFLFTFIFIFTVYNACVLFEIGYGTLMLLSRFSFKSHHKSHWLRIATRQSISISLVMHQKWLQQSIQLGNVSTCEIYNRNEIRNHVYVQHPFYSFCVSITIFLLLFFFVWYSREKIFFFFKPANSLKRKMRI